jgi:hypothetical protein
MNETTITKCHGHALDGTPGGVKHVCTDLCSFSDCCKLTGHAAVEACHEADRLYISGDVAGRNALLSTVAPEFRNGREIIEVRPTCTWCGEPSTHNRDELRHYYDGDSIAVIPECDAATRPGTLTAR